MSRDYLNDNNRIVKKRNHNKIKNTYQKGKGLNLEYPNIRIIENNYVFTENSDKMLNNNYIQTLEKRLDEALKNDSSHTENLSYMKE